MSIASGAFLQGSTGHEGCYGGTGSMCVRVGRTPSLLPPPKRACAGAALHLHWGANLAAGLGSTEERSARMAAITAVRERTDSVAGARHVSSGASAAADATDTATKRFPRPGRGTRTQLASNTRRANVPGAPQSCAYCSEPAARCAACDGCHGAAETVCSELKALMVLAMLLENIRLVALLARPAEAKSHRANPEQNLWSSVHA